jgi:hypothetical protein
MSSTNRSTITVMALVGIIGLGATSPVSARWRIPEIDRFHQQRLVHGASINGQKCSEAARRRANGEYACRSGGIVVQGPLDPGSASPGDRATNR